jgi:hypothetical protein
MAARRALELGSILIYTTISDTSLQAHAAHAAKAIVDGIFISTKTTYHEARDSPIHTADGQQVLC